MNDPKVPKEPEPNLYLIGKYANTKVLSSAGWVDERVQAPHKETLSEILNMSFEDIFGFDKGK